MLVAGRGVGFDLEVEAGHVAGLEYVGDPEVSGLQRALAVAGSFGQLEHLVRGSESLLEVLGRAERYVLCAQRPGERRGVAMTAGDHDRLLGDPS